MKQVMTIILVSVFLFSCNSNKKEKYLIDGKWRYENSKKGREIVFSNGLYSQIRWNDDLVYKSNGKYYFNENKNRSEVTITLAPDLQHSEKDTILLPCENIDIVILTDSVMFTKKPTQWLYRGESTRRFSNNEIIKFIKVKKTN